jgi:hypothetical protein
VEDDASSGENDQHRNQGRRLAGYSPGDDRAYDSDGCAGCENRGSKLGMVIGHGRAQTPSNAIASLHVLMQRSN